MPEEIVMPRLSDTMEEGRIARWLKREGDPIKTGDELMEVETDKATLPYTAYQDGTLVKIIIGDGESAPVGTVVGIMARAGESVEEVARAARAARAAPAAPGAPPPAALRPAAPEPSPPEATPPAPPPAAPQAQPQVAPAAARPIDTVKASPLARVMAEQAGLDLRQLAGQGRGPGGRIVKQDVEAAVQRGVARAPAPAAAPPAPPAAYEERELSRIRLGIARNLGLSKPGAPHIYLTVDVEMDAALALREQLNAFIGEDQRARLSINDLVLKATALTLRKYPDLNAHYIDGKPPKMRLFQNVNIGIAVQLEDGLFVPVLRDADKKSLGQIAIETKEIYERLRSGKPRSDEYSGGTFSVSGLGQWGIDEFQAIINPPQVGILAIGAAAPKAVVRDGEIVVRTMMRVTLSSDHRAVDGVYSAQFLQEFKRLLENPLSLVL